MGLSKETKEKAKNLVKVPYRLKDTTTLEGKDVAIFERPGTTDLWLWDEQLEERADGIYCRQSYMDRQALAAAKRGN